MEPDDPLRSGKLQPPFTSDYNALHCAMGQHQSSPTVNQSDKAQDMAGFSQELGQSHQSMEDNVSTPETKIIKYLGERQKAQPFRKEGPLQLLDLPLDNLKDILKEVTHTNDLANLALVNSALHGIVTPVIYSRFDIVWPDTNSSAEPRTGVDALTYGLATLVMSEDLFQSANTPTNCFPEPCRSYSCAHCGSTNYLGKDSNPLLKKHRTRRGNYYSQFTKKFSLGNGPADWVQEYLVTKESGKMLGTLVALSVARMPNLETFIWDMPTGILRDIWIALSSLGDYQNSKLEKLWVRLHDNKAALQEAGMDTPSPAQPPSQATLAPAVSPSPQQLQPRPDHDIFGVTRVVWSNHHVEKPNFSILPALRSLTVLDIDEVNYLIELSVLLGRSVQTLRELRLGMASTLHMSGFVREAKEIKHLFTGGVFALLMNEIYNHTLDMEKRKMDSFIRNHLKQLHGDSAVASPTASLSNLNLNSKSPEELPTDMTNGSRQDEQEPLIDRPSSQASELDENTIDPALFQNSTTSNQEQLPMTGPEPELSPIEQPLPGPRASETIREPRIDGGLEALKVRETLDPSFKLKLETLELERARLPDYVLLKAIDFTVLTSLTLLQCGDTAQLWEGLKRQYPPRKSILATMPMQSPTSPRGQPPRLRRKPSSESLSGAIEYQLNLKRIHTDTVSKELISFLKTTLAPNSLEWMFLQENGTPPSTVILDSIYRGPLRRHRASLTKVMIDSAYGPATSRARGVAARKWMFSREVLTFVTSGKMSRLRELAMAIEYRDWHFFLQRLPQIPHLRSMYLPYIADHGNSFSCKEAAMGAVDVVAIKPEVQLCYLAIKNKCYEILEKEHKPKFANHGTSTDDTDDDTDDHDHPEDEDSEDEAPAPAASAPEPEDTDSDAGERSPDTDEEGGHGPSGKKKNVKFRLREILFYDDKISVFKARHGRL